MRIISQYDVLLKLNFLNSIKEVMASGSPNFSFYFLQKIIGKSIVMGNLYTCSTAETITNDNTVIITAKEPMDKITSFSFIPEVSVKRVDFYQI
jgi:hypothetical protein